MQVLLLGPVAVLDGDRVRHVTSTRQAALLAVLGSNSGGSVSQHRLIDALWGEQPPPTARNTLQVHVSALRRLLGADAIRSEGDGYRLDRPAHETDVGRFRQLTEEGHGLFTRGRHAEAARVLRAALALWRGDALAGVDSTWANEERERLSAIRLLAATTRLDADLALGRHLLVLDEIDHLCAEHPYDEQLAARRMIALYRGGRQQEALAVYDGMRRTLVEELGVDPGPELQAMHRRVLEQDSSLQPTASVRAGQTPWRAPLPAFLSDPLLGRESLLEELEQRARTERILTLVGPSGIGKTRLATELAQRLQASRDLGAVLVDAAGLTGTEDLLVRLAGQVESGDLDDPNQVRRVLEDGQVVVVVDDLEPGSTIADEIGQLANAGTATWVLTATRPLRLPRETVVPVGPLETHCGDPMTGEPGAGVRLLLRRAAAAGARFDETHETLAAAAECARLLDGIPLALELAAPAALLGLADLAHDLESARREGRDSVSISFDTSLDKLDAAEKFLLSILCVADAKVDLDLLAHVRLPDLTPGQVPRAVAALVRDGLVRRTPGAHGYAMFDLIGSIAVQADARISVDRRSQCVHALVAACARVFSVGQYLPSQLRSPDQARRWMALHALGRRAIGLAGAHGLVEEAAMFTVALGEQLTEDREVAPDPRGVAALADASGLSLGRQVDLRIISGMQYLQQGAVDEGVAQFDLATAAADRLGEPGRISQVLANRGTAILSGWHVLGDDAREVSDLGLAQARATGDEELEAAALALRPAAPTAADDQRRGLQLSRSRGWVGLELLCLANLADRALEGGDPHGAQRLALEAAALATDLHNPAMAGWMAATVEAARSAAGSSSSLCAQATALLTAWEVDDVRTVSDVVLKLAVSARHRGDVLTAGECLGLYQAAMATGEHQPAQSETDLIHTWLDGLEPIAPSTSLDAAIRRIAERATDDTSASVHPHA